MSFELSTWASHARDDVNRVLSTVCAEVWPAGFGEALRYPLFTGGKRMRPLLAVATYEALGGPNRLEVLPAAAAVELIHTYSLVHDDLPAMDDDDERRGRPTVHVEYDEATAILVGDALLTEAFELLATAPVSAETRVRMVSELARAAGYRGMVGGQAGDIAAAGRDIDLDTLTRVHRLKTGALIRCSVVLGGLAAGADANTLSKLAGYGEDVGLAFQLADDVLDQAQDEGEDGNPSYVKLLGVEETRAAAKKAADRAVEAVRSLHAPDALIALATYSVERDT